MRSFQKGLDLIKEKIISFNKWTNIKKTFLKENIKVLQNF